MSQVAPTVMGPGAESVPTTLYEPPKLYPNTDKFIWRRAVRTWAQKVRSFAKGGDNKAKGIANSLGITLYAAMDYSFVQVLDRAITVGDLKLIADDDDDEEVINQMEVIEKIIDLVAKDSVTDGVRRLVKMSQNVHECKRQKNETYESFAERFRGIGQTYLNHCHAGDTTQDSQNFAMLLLENANLPSSTFNNLVSILIADAKDKSKSIKKYISIAKDKLTAIEHSFEKAIGLWHQSHAQSTLPNQPPVSNVQIQESWDAHKRCIANAKHKTRKGKDDRVPYAISLDDAVAALKDIKCPEVAQSQKPKQLPDTLPPKISENIEDDTHRGTMMGKRREYQDRNDGAPRESRWSRFKFKTRIPANTGPKANTRCADCSEYGHWRGDPECKARREPKRVRFNADKPKDNSDKPNGQYFQ